MGDVLVVTVTPDRYVDKGPNRPAFSEDLRLRAVASLEIVDYVALNKWPTAAETLRLLVPDIYVKGSEFRDADSDMTGKMGKEAEVVRQIGARLAFTDDIVFSSTQLINQYLSRFPEEIKEYLKVFRQRYSIDDILGILEKMTSLKVLTIGDAILDEYQYCEVIGKSSKEPTLALKYLSRDLFAGGVLAVGNHLANFAGGVQLATVLGSEDSYEDFIRERLNEKIDLYFVARPKARTLIKRRFLDSYSLNKVFEVYVMDDSDLPRDLEQNLCEWLRENLCHYDLVTVADFGHGAISEAIVNVLVENSPFLAVNTQANAGNRGFHTITRYPRADYVCLAEPEIRLEARKLRGELGPIIAGIAEKMGCKQLVVTRGKKGCIVRNQRGEFVEVPAFVHRVVDRIGAGDAFLSVTSLAAVLEVPSEVLAFIGNVTGMLAVEILGNQKAVDKMRLQKTIVSLLK